MLIFEFNLNIYIYYGAINRIFFRILSLISFVLNSKGCVIYLIFPEGNLETHMYLYITVAVAEVSDLEPF